VIVHQSKAVVGGGAENAGMEKAGVEISGGNRKGQKRRTELVGRRKTDYGTPNKCGFCADP